MERRLALMAGAGVLPGRAAGLARAQGWRVIAFVFEDAPGLAEQVDEVVASDVTAAAAVLAGLRQRQVEAALFVGKFWKHSLFAREGGADETGRALAAGGLGDARLTTMVVSALEALGIEVLDQRRFLAPWILSAETVTRRRPSPAEWMEIHAAMPLARSLASVDVGQTVVRARGVTVAVEAVEGTDETIRRGTRLAGPGAVVVKAVAPGHDYRFDVPAVGPATLAAMAEGGATALALPRGRILAVDADAMVAVADGADIAVVTVDDGE